MLRKITLTASVLLGLLVCAIGTAGAATITVTANAPDVLNTLDGSCALREAITNINNGTTTFGDCPITGTAFGINDTIILPAGTYTNTIPGFDNLNAKGDLDITTSVAISGAGATTTFIDGGVVGRVLHITTPGTTVSITGVTIRNGNANNFDGGTGGGGIFSSAALTITNSIIDGNGPGGGINCSNG